MREGVYVTGGAPASGKSAVALGIQQLLARRVRRVGVFRPVVSPAGEDDGLLALLRSRGADAVPYAASLGVGVDRVRADEERALGEILGRFQAVADGCDAVLAVGTDFAGVGPAGELAFNARVALNLGLPVVGVVSGHERTADEVLSAVSVALTTVEGAGCDVAAVVVNRVRDDQLEAVAAALPYGSGYVLPEVHLLMAPTVGQVAQACDGELLAGDPALLGREAMGMLVGAMTVPNLLERLYDRALLITPGDRTDVLLAALYAHGAPGLPAVAGVVLTGGLRPPDRLLASLDDAARDVVAQPSYFGTLMVRLGMADGMVSGATHTTAETVRPSLELVKTRPGVALVSSVFFMCLADRVLVYGDCAVNPHPTAEELADIAASSAETAAQFGIEPRIAMLSYSTGASGAGEEVERVRAATELVRARVPDLSVEGPIQYDAAVDASVARTKLPGSAVAGGATVFIFPDLNTGNNTCKAVQRSAGAVAVGPVLQGLNKPVNDLSRGATVEDIVNTVAITAIQAA